MKKETRKELLALAVFLLAMAAFLTVSGNILTPKRQNYGSTWGQFLKEEKNSIDVMVYGSSIAYCDVAPAVLWDETGATAYDMAGPEQTIPFTYYYVRETYRTQTPKFVCIEVSGMYFKRYQSYTQINVGYMPPGRNRLEATFAASEPKQRTGLLFPLYDYHSRWSSLEPEDMEIGLHGYGQDDCAGYTRIFEGHAMSGVTQRGETDDRENYARNLEYLKKTVACCQAHGSKVLLFLSPSCWRLSDAHLAALKKDLSEINGASYYDFNAEGLDAYDLNYMFYDNLHFNSAGARVFSTRFADYLRNVCGLTPTAGADQTLWTKRSEVFQAAASTFK